MSVSGEPPDLTVRSHFDLEVSVETRQRIQNELATALGRSPALKTTEGRNLFLSYLEPRLPGPPLAYHHSTPHLYFADLVMTCSKYPTGLDQVASVVRFLDPGPETDAIERIVDEWQALTSWPGLEPVWMHLREAVLQIDLPTAVDAYRAAGAGRAAVLPPKRCTTSWQVLLYLFGQNARPNCAPPWLQFVHYLEVRDARPLPDLVQQGLHDLAAELALPEDSQTSSTLIDTVSQQRGLLEILLLPRPAEAEVFTLVQLYGWDGEHPDTFDRQEDLVVSRADLQAAIEAVVRQVERLWAERVKSLRIEVFLPLSLLNEPVEWWPKNSSRSDDVSPLALFHPVVIRSTDRLQDRGTHGRWLDRSNRLTDDKDSSAIFWPAAPDREEHLRLVRGELMENENYVGMILSEPPSPDLRVSQELLCAIDAGIPFVAWHRELPSDQALQRFIKDLTTPNVAKVPHEVAKLRRATESKTADERDRLIVRSLAILWDDARSVPRALLDASEN